MVLTSALSLTDVPSAACAADATRTRSSPYFVNAAFDVAFVGGLSIATFLLLSRFERWIRTDTAPEILLVLVWFINYPHFSATLQRLYRTRQNAAQYPLTSYFLPVIVLAGMLASLVWPLTFAAYFVKLMLLWSSYHFSGQTLGISVIYARRHGVTLEGNERRALSLFIFSTYLAYMLRAGIIGGSYYGIDHPTLEVPLWLPPLAYRATLGAGGFLIAFVLSWSVRNRRLFPVIILLPAITQYVWFLPGFAVNSFFIFVPLFHSLQYLPIALAMQLGDRMGQARATRTPRQFGIEVVRWCGLNLVGGALLFFCLPAVVSWFGVELSLATGVIAAAIQLHHFVVDGVIWKLRNTSIASPLMQNLRTYASPQA